MNSTVHPEKSNICAKRIRNDLSQNRKLQCKTFSLSQFLFLSLSFSFPQSDSFVQSVSQSDRHIPRFLKFELKCLNIITRNLEFNNDLRYYQTIYIWVCVCVCVRRIMWKIISTIYSQPVSKWIWDWESMRNRVSEKQKKTKIYTDRPLRSSKRNRKGTKRKDDIWISHFSKMLNKCQFIYDKCQSLISCKRIENSTQSTCCFGMFKLWKWFIKV